MLLGLVAADVDHVLVVLVAVATLKKNVVKKKLTKNNGIKRLSVTTEKV